MMKGNLFTTHYGQLENKLTEAFLKVLKHSTSELTEAFIMFCEIEGQYKKFTYDFQFGNSVHSLYKRAILIAIAETEDIRSENPVSEQMEDVEEYEGIPDGYIHAAEGSLAILFEIKRGSGTLTRPQLNAHKKRFKNLPADKVEEKIITWQATIQFFKKQRLQYKYGHRNSLLIDEFLSFCEFHFIGEKTSEVTPARIINLYDTNGFLKELNTFALSFPSVSVISKADSVDYLVEHLPRGCFFTIWYARDLIILKPKKPIGLYLDLVVAKTFGQNAETPYDYKTQETFIPIPWIDSAEQLQGIQELISIAYNNKVGGDVPNLQKFVQDHDITKADFDRARIGRSDESLLNRRTQKHSITPLRNELLSILTQ